MLKARRQVATLAGGGVGRVGRTSVGRREGGMFFPELVAPCGPCNKISFLNWARAAERESALGDASRFPAPFRRHLEGSSGRAAGAREASRVHGAAGRASPRFRSQALLSASLTSHYSRQKAHKKFTASYLQMVTNPQ